MRTLFIILLSLFSLSSFAEPLKGNLPNPYPNCEKVTSWPPTSPGFSRNTYCAQFAAIAYCHCSEKYSSDYCHHIKIKGIYTVMVSVFGSIDRACKEGQKDVDQTTCVQQWGYYNDPKNPCPDA